MLAISEALAVGTMGECGETMAERRKMAMLVGNTVEGDSRVEKAAVSAKALGYEVYLVGIKNKTVPQFSSYQSIPIYRPIPDFSEYTAWRKTLNLDIEPAEEFIDRKQQEFNESLRSWELKIAKFSAEVESTKALPHLLAPEKFKAPERPARDWERRVTRLAQPLRKRYQRALRATVNARNVSAWRKSAIPGEWRNLWPQISGFEEAFLRALRLIQPDIIHVHDRHPMSAAVRFSSEMREKGVEVPWIYDAHEFLPGQRFSGPAQHRYGWLNLESEMIQRADAVITVSNDLAASLAKRHHLNSNPFVVENAPLADLTPNPDESRRSIREELGVPQDAPLAVYVGKLAERRGIYDAVEAAARIPNLHLAFVGSKDSKPRAQIIDLGTQFQIRDRLHIVDYVPSSYVTSYISSADIGLSPLYSTPAHEQALATKIREYIVAGLPIVGSDLKAQGSFIRRHSIGATHVANDSRSMAEAIEKTLTNLPQLRANVAAIRQFHTWEKQEVTLAKAWNRAGEVRPDSRREYTMKEDAGLARAGTVFSRARSKKLAPLFSAIRASSKRVAIANKSSIYLQDKNGEWWTLGPAHGDVEATFTTWCNLVAMVDVLVATDFEPLFCEVMGTGKNLSEQLERAGIGFFNWTTVSDVLSAALMGDAEDELAFPATKRAQKMKARALEISENRRSTIVSDDPGILAATSSSIWLPGPVDATRFVKQASDAGRVVVVVGSAARTAREREALEQLKFDYPMIDFVDYTEARTPMEASVFIDSLGGSAWNSIAESAFISRIPVLAQYPPQILGRLDVTPPFIPTAHDLVGLNLRLVLSGRIEPPNPDEYLTYRQNLINRAFLH